MNRELGLTQRTVLRSLREHGRWHDGCSWHWDVPSRTVAVLEGLVRRGYATKMADQVGYFPTPPDNSQEEK